ncbi:MAG: TIGR03905 family TSCPD domain-containing protein [Planctomycetia bacterium]|nr:TIGR03905 family TSCPD domain-containing protein [Planctomycetia bacterium]
MDYQYKTEGTCSQMIQFHLEGNIVSGIRFYGGCNGNLQAIARLVDGMSVEEIESKLKGISCGGGPTSCGDQLARAVRYAYDHPEGIS